MKQNCSFFRSEALSGALKTPNLYGSDHHIGLLNEHCSGPIAGRGWIDYLGEINQFGSTISLSFISGEFIM